MEREDGMEPVGAFQMRVVIGEPTPGGGERWERRVSALADWLLFQWQSATAKDGTHDAAA